MCLVSHHVSNYIVASNRLVTKNFLVKTDRIKKVPAGTGTQDIIWI